MLAIAIAFCFSFSTTGCNKPAENKTKTEATGTGTAAKDFKGSATTGTLDKKDAKAEITFSNGEVKSVDPIEKDGVKTEIKDKKVVIFTQTIDAPAEDKTVDFVVKGGKEDKEEVKIKITIKKKSS
jgi:hypothetical protein